MTTLEELFRRNDVRLWGTASLEGRVEGSEGYKCIVFCLPYDLSAVAALPRDELMEKCKEQLAQRTKEIYRDIAEVLSECHFVLYDDVDQELKLSAKGISQKVLGYWAGLGWIGKSSLLVTPEFGPRVRLGTIFTRDSLADTIRPDVPGGCGTCMACSEICPAGAISETGYDAERCRQIVNDAKGNPKTFCGLCMQVCPYG